MLLLIYQVPYHHTVAVGSPEATRLIGGFHDAEGGGDFTYRWTTANASVRLPQGVFPGEATLVLSGDRPGSTPPDVSFRTPSGNETRTRTTGDFAPYMVPLGSDRAAWNPAHTPSLTITPSDTAVPPRDNRALGVAVQRIVIYTNPVRFGPVVPPVLAILLVLALTMLLALAVLSITPPLWLCMLFVLCPALIAEGYLALRRADDPGEQARAVAAFGVAAFLALAATHWRPLTAQRWVRAMAWLDGRWVMFVALGIACGYALYASHALYGRLYDDAYITLRYAHNFADGNGLVYNPGERAVEGYTNFSLTVLLALFAKIGLPLVTMAKVCSIGAALGAVAATYALAGMVLTSAPRWLCALPGVLMAGCGWFAFFAAIGLETHLFALLVTVAATLVLRRHWSWAATVFALAYLTRPEGAGLWAVTVGWVALSSVTGGGAERWRVASAFSWPFVLVAGAHEAFRLWYYGEPLPNTFYDKVGSTVAQVERGGDYLLHVLPTLHPWTLALLVVALAAVPSGVVQRGAGRYLALLVGAFAGYVVLVGGDFIGPRFLFHIFPLLSVLLVAAVWSVAGWALRAIGTHSTARDHALAAVCTVLVAVWFWLPLMPPGTFLPEQSHMRLVTGLSVLGDYLRDHANPKETLAIEVAGVAPYTSGLRTIDMLGLNDYHIAHEVKASGEDRAGHEKMDPDYVLARKPTYIAVGMNPSTGKPGRGLNLPEFDAHYERIALVRMNATVATPDLVLPVTPTTDVQRAIADGYTYALYRRRP